jgi:flagellar biosynthesis/type III secretory pathway M-ring protein FliF/YscJ
MRFTDIRKSHRVKPSEYSTLYVQTMVFVTVVVVVVVVVVVLIVIVVVVVVVVVVYSSSLNEPDMLSFCVLATALQLSIIGSI